MSLGFERLIHKFFLLEMILVKQVDKHCLDNDNLPQVDSNSDPVLWVEEGDTTFFNFTSDSCDDIIFFLKYVQPGAVLLDDACDAFIDAITHGLSEIQKRTDSMSHKQAKAQRNTPESPK